MSIDDLVLTWLSPKVNAAGPETASDERECPSCGYWGAMIFEQRCLMCPACLGMLPDPLAEEVGRIVRCPNCDVEIPLSDRERNKTIVCSRCKFFLGCIYRDEPSRQLEVFGVHLPSLLRHLTYVLWARSRRLTVEKAWSASQRAAFPDPPSAPSDPGKTRKGDSPNDPGDGRAIKFATLINACPALVSGPPVSQPPNGRPASWGSTSGPRSPTPGLGRS